MCICVSDTVYMNDVHVYTSDVYVWYCTYEWHICVHICLYVRICVRICLYVRRICICVSVILYIEMTYMAVYMHDVYVYTSDVCVYVSVILYIWMTYMSIRQTYIYDPVNDISERKNVIHVYNTTHTHDSFTCVIWMYIWKGYAITLTSCLYKSFIWHKWTNEWHPYVQHNPYTWLVHMCNMNVYMNDV